MLPVGLALARSLVESSGGRHRGEIQSQFLNKAYVSDYSDGLLYQLKQGVYTDNGVTIAREFIGRHNKAGNWITISQLWLEMEAGIGLVSGQGVNPQVMMQISRDGGHTWGGEVWAGFGRIGEYRVRAIWNRLGIAKDWLFKFRITDPVKTVFVAAWAKYRK